jgi:hypothetical protein
MTYRRPNSFAASDVAAIMRLNCPEQGWIYDGPLALANEATTGNPQITIIVIRTEEGAYERHGEKSQGLCGGI